LLPHHRIYIGYRRVRIDRRWPKREREGEREGERERGRERGREGREGREGEQDTQAGIPPGIGIEYI